MTERGSGKTAEEWANEVGLFWERCEPPVLVHAMPDMARNYESMVEVIAKAMRQAREEAARLAEEGQSRGLDGGVIAMAIRGDRQFAGGLI